MGFFSSRKKSFYDKILEECLKDEKKLPSYLDRDIRRLSGELENASDEETFDQIFNSRREYRDVEKHLASDVGSEWISRDGIYRTKYERIINELKEEQFNL